MSIVNFSVPEDVKVSSNQTFEGQNKSSVIADLMREGNERARRIFAPSFSEARYATRRWSHIDYR